MDLVDGPLLRVPRDLVAAARFAARVIEQGTALGGWTLRTEAGGALLAGALAHANTRLPSLASAGAGVLLAAYAHASGWGLPRGGAQAIADALAADLIRHGGTIETGHRIDRLDALDWGDPAAGDILVLDTSPRLLLTGSDLPDGYARALRRFRYGQGVTKIDLALDGPVPWINPEVAAAPTVHVGGTRAEIVAAERAVAAGRIPERPYVLVVQPSVVDPTRAPEGKAVLWAYTHVPAGSPQTAADVMLAQIERFAPGLRDRILALHERTAAQRGETNPTEIGGDISGGALTVGQLLRRPVPSRHPWRTPLPGCIWRPPPPRPALPCTGWQGGTPPGRPSPT